MLLRSGKDRVRGLAFLLLGIAFLMACGNVEVIQTGAAPTPTEGSILVRATIPAQTGQTGQTGQAQGQLDPEGQDTDRDGIVGPADQCPRQPENYNKVFDTDGCPDNGIQELMDVAAQYINQYWQKEFAQAGASYQPPSEIVPYTSEIETACGPAIPNNAFYCPNSNGIYYDQNFLQKQLDTDGDFAPVTILAHEWGHLVQGNLGILDSNLYTSQIELQADCFAGAWANYAGELKVLEEGDLNEGATALFKAGDDINTAWFDPQAHGQPEQRIQFFNTGLKRNSDACFEDINPGNQ